jgi:hypothetical protein
MLPLRDSLKKVIRKKCGERERFANYLSPLGYNLHEEDWYLNEKQEVFLLFK